MDPRSQERQRTFSSESVSDQSRRKRRGSMARRNETFPNGVSSYSDEESDQFRGDYGGSLEGKRRSGRRGKKDEPMSPIAVVLYVTAAYLIFQLLTRSDEFEILSHLPKTSSLHAHQHHNIIGGGSNLHSDLHHGGYNHMGMYPIPPKIPSPLPKVNEDGTTSWFRLILGILFYPFYLLATILLLPIPFLHKGVMIVYTILTTLLSPFITSGKILIQTFVLGPVGFISSVLRVFYPIYTFIGGLIGLGCLMGFVTAYLGKLVLNVLLGNGFTFKRHADIPRSRMKTVSRSRKSASKKGSRVDSRRNSDSDQVNEKLVTPRTIHFAHRRDQEDKTQRNGAKGRDVEMEYGEFEGFTSGGEPRAVGMRRRRYGFEH